VNLLLHHLISVLPVISMWQETAEVVPENVYTAEWRGPE
jgi:hypothetical protein